MKSPVLHGVVFGIVFSFCAGAPGDAENIRLLASASVETRGDRALTAAEVEQLLAKVKEIGNPIRPFLNLLRLRAALRAGSPTLSDVEAALKSDMESARSAWENDPANRDLAQFKKEHGTKGTANPEVRVAAGGETRCTAANQTPQGGVWKRLNDELKPLLATIASTAPARIVSSPSAAIPEAHHPAAGPATMGREPRKPELPEIQALWSPWQAALKAAAAERDKKLANLDYIYLLNVDKLQKDRAAAGDLDGALAAKAELDRLGTHQTPNEEQRSAMSPALRTLRGNYETAWKGYLDEAARRDEALLQKHLVDLEGLERRITTTGDLERALLVKAERERLLAEASKPQPR